MSEYLYPESPDSRMWLALSLVTEPGGNALWDHYRSCDEDLASLYENLIPDKNACNTLTERVIAACKNAHIGIITYDDEEHYPQVLRELYNPPSVLYYTGDVKVLTSAPCLAIVGARGSSAYAINITGKIVKALLTFEPDYVIVSGFAMGTDIAAHLAAVREGGRTIAVKACGLDYAYPSPNMKYTKEIADRGVFISEYPPGAHPNPKNFPVRNRLIAALGDGTVVTEGGSQSGALSTAHLAADFGKDVFVIPPHNIAAPENQGNIELLREGAIPVYGTRDILAHNQKFVSELLAEAKRQLSKKSELQDDFLNTDSDDVPENLSELLTPEQRYAKEIAALETDISPLTEPTLTIYDIIKSSPGDFNIEILTGQLERDPDEILDILIELEMENYIFRAPDGSFF